MNKELLQTFIILRKWGQSMYTIKQMCQEGKLSRSTLLYYDSIGLLKPGHRTESNYRLYTEEDKHRLQKICTFREAGIPLEQMKELLDADISREAEALTEKLQVLNKEIRELRIKQKLIVELLKSKYITDTKLMLNMETFAQLFSEMGFDEIQMGHFHKRFESNDPEAHRFFLEFLGMEDEEIKALMKKINYS